MDSPDRKRFKLDPKEEAGWSFWDNPLLIENTLLQMQTVSQVYKACKTNRGFYSWCQDQLFWLIWMKQNALKNDTPLAFLDFTTIVIDNDLSAPFDALLSDAFIDWYLFEKLVFVNPYILAQIEPFDDENFWRQIYPNDEEKRVKLGLVLSRLVEKINITDFWREWSKRGLLLVDDVEDAKEAAKIFNKYELARPFENDELYESIFIKEWQYDEKASRFDTWKQMLAYQNVPKVKTEIVTRLCTIKLLSFEPGKTLLYIRIDLTGAPRDNLLIQNLHDLSTQSFFRLAKVLFHNGVFSAMMNHGEDRLDSSDRKRVARQLARIVSNLSR